MNSCRPPLCGRLAYLAWILIIALIVFEIYLANLVHRNLIYLSTCNSIYPDYPSRPDQSYKKLNCLTTVTNTTLLLQTTTKPFLEQNIAIVPGVFERHITCYLNFNLGLTIDVNNKCVDASKTKTLSDFYFNSLIFIPLFVAMIVFTLCVKSNRYEIELSNYRELNVQN